MKPYYECHVTFLVDSPEPPSNIPRGWKFTGRIAGDPDLGEGVRAYLTRHLPQSVGIPQAVNQLEMAASRLRFLGYKVLRLKVELVLHDSRPRG